MPKVSVVMPAYNAEKYIAEAIDSILNQTFTDFEFIIINDGSTDRTKEIILKYDDPRIVLLENEKNSGIVVTLNKGLDAAQGEYIARMDADDIAVSERLTMQVEYMDKHPEIGVLGTAFQVFSENQKKEKHYPSTDPENLRAELLFTSCIAHPTVMIRVSVLKDHALRYDRRFEGREDYALWWSISEYTKISVIPEILHYYRSHSNQITQKKSAEQERRAYEFYRYRMQAFGIELRADEDRALFRYCIGDYKQFNQISMASFEKAISKVIEKNKQTRYFSMKSLKSVCSSALIRTTQVSGLNRISALKIYTRFLLNGCFSFALYVKSFCFNFIVLRK